MASIFTKIINKELPCYKIYEDEKFLVFLDKFPSAKGHTLVIPKEEINKLFDLEKDKYLQMMSLTYRVASAIENAITCKRVGMAVVGLEVPHAHVHLIPLNDESDMILSNCIDIKEEEFDEIANKIKSKL